MNGARESIHNRCKEHGQTNDLAQRPVREPRPQRSPTRLSRQSRRPLNILRTSTARLLPRQRQTYEIQPDKERQKLVPTARTNQGELREPTSSQRTLCSIRQLFPWNSWTDRPYSSRSSFQPSNETGELLDRANLSS